MAGIPGVAVAVIVKRGVGYNLSLRYGVVACEYGVWRAWGNFPYTGGGIPTCVAGFILCLSAVPCSFGQPA